MHKNRTDALLHRYIKEIRKNLPCPTEEEKRALDNLKESVSAYLFEYPEATAEDIAQRFGAPTQLADSFLDVEGISRSVKKHSRLQRTILGILAVAVLVAIIFGTVYMIEVYNFTHGNIVREIGYGAPLSPESGAERF